MAIPFGEYQLPQAVIALKQGVGRLIRDDNDKGVLVICDPRLRTKSYGTTFLNSLPRVPRTSKQEVVERFFEIIKSKSAISQDTVDDAVIDDEVVDKKADSNSGDSIDSTDKSTDGNKKQ